MENITAYILVVTKVGEEHKVKEKIEDIAQEMEDKAWLETKPVFGEYDLIVIVEANDISTIDKIVSKIRMLNNVVKTMTLIAS